MCGGSACRFCPSSFQVRPVFLPPSSATLSLYLCSSIGGMFLQGETVHEQEARVRLEIQSLSTVLAAKRLAGAQEALDYSRERMLDDDFWFRLAGELQDLSRQYLDIAIFAG